MHLSVTQAARSFWQNLKYLIGVLHQAQRVTGLCLQQVHAVFARWLHRPVMLSSAASFLWEVAASLFSLKSLSGGTQLVSLTASHSSLLLLLAWQKVCFSQWVREVQTAYLWCGWQRLWWTPAYAKSLCRSQESMTWMPSKVRQQTNE